MRLSISNGLSISGQQTGSAGGGGGASAVSFGALTLAGAGGVAKPAGATAISDAGGTNLQLTSGFAVPATNGVTSGTVTWDDGTEWTVTAVANKYSAKSLTELSAAYTAANTATATGILCRAFDDSASARTTLASKAFSNQFTIEPHDFTEAATPSANTYTVKLPGIIIGNTSTNIRIYGLDLYETLAGAVTEGDGIVQITSGGSASGITIEACEIHSRSFEDAYDNGVFADASNYVGPHASQTAFFASLDAIRGITVDDATNIRCLNNYIHDVTRGIEYASVDKSGANRSKIEGNDIVNVITNFTTVTAGSGVDGLDIQNNRMMHVWGGGEVPSNSLHTSIGLSFDGGSSFLNDVVVRGNKTHLGWARRKYTEDSLDTFAQWSGATGMKFNDPTETYTYRNVTVAHNLLVGHGICIEFSGAQGVDIYNNTLSTEEYSATSGEPIIYFQGAENARIWNNIAPSSGGLGVNDGGTENGQTMVTTTDTSKAYGNFGGGVLDGGLGYETVFQGISGSFALLTLDQLETAYTPVSGTYPLTATEKKGALGTGYWDGTTDTAPAFSARAATGTSLTPTTTVWDGTSNLSRAALTGATTSRYATIAWQGELHADSDGDDIYFVYGASANPSARRLPNGTMRFIFDGGGGGQILQVDTSIVFNSSLGKFSWAFSVDTLTGQMSAALNGEPMPLSVNPAVTSVTSLEVINWATTSMVLMARTGAGLDGVKCSFDSMYIDDAYIDFDTTAGLSTLFGSDGLMIDLSATSPLVLIQGKNAAAINGGTANSGTGGAFTAGGTAVTDADVTAPTLSSPTDAANGATASTGSVSTDEGNGTLYWVVTTSATAPSAAQVKAGQDNSGSAATASGSQAVSGTGVQTLSPAPSGLTASTAYTTHFMHEDAAANQSAVSSASGFTTASAGLVVNEGSSTATFTTSGGYRVAELTDGQTLVVTTGGTPTGYEMVGGGGGGGGRLGGGGGAGELIQRTTTPPALTAQTYTATVGAGGTAGDNGVDSGDGGNTRLIGGTSDDVSLTALGGGGGGTNAVTVNGNAGGSGGGAAQQTAATGGASTASDGVGFAGGDDGAGAAGSGGGGAGGAGEAAPDAAGGAGGAGVTSVCPGKSDTLGAGGHGGPATGSSASPATGIGTGGDGGSGTFNARAGAAGTSGIIRVWWPV